MMVGRRRRSNDDQSATASHGRRSSRLSFSWGYFLLALSTTEVVVRPTYSFSTSPALQISLPQQRQRQHRLPYHQYTQSSSSSSSSFALEEVSQRRTFLFDGGELQSFLAHGSSEQPTPQHDTNSNNNSRRINNDNNNLMVGCLTLVTGTTTTTTTSDAAPSRRIVGVQKQVSNDNSSTEEDDTIVLDTNVQIYKHTAAIIPQYISDNDALSTAAASLVGIHCALPNKVDKVGGSTLSDTDVFYSGRVVVMGGNELACFFADGLAALGIDVCLVSTGGAKTRNKHVNAMSPSVESDDDEDVEIGFASAIGHFDSLIDTLANERKGMAMDSTATNGGGVGIMEGGRSGVLSLLQTRHQCNKHISTTTQAQQIIKNDGILFGPGKANAHVKSMESISLDKCWNLVPSAGFGPSTLQTLFDNNVIFPAKGYTKSSVVTRGWDMKDFWEETSWPRDSSGTGVRYGLPALDDEEDDDYLDEAFQLERMQLRSTNIRTRIGGEGGMDDDEVQLQTELDEQNPYVTRIAGVNGLASNILSRRRSSVVFVSMRSCRTCKRIDSMFTKMARECNNGLMYAKADTTGLGGKMLGRQLGVVAVPAFVLFRDGIRYGLVSTSKLPSDRLDKAIRDLKAGEDFDTSLEEGD